MKAATVLYDAACPLCSSLAAMLERRGAGGLGCESWQDYCKRTQPEQDGLSSAACHAPHPVASPDRIHVVMEGELFSGVLAWEKILTLHPDFSGLMWMAARLGLTRQAAYVTQSTTSLLRRLCSRCPR